MIKKILAIMLIAIGIFMFVGGMVYGTINYDCTDYSCGERIFTECEEWDTNQQLALFTTVIGFFIFIIGEVIRNDIKGSKSLP